MKKSLFKFPANRIYIKVKIKSLAEEARIIRSEEHKAKYDSTREGLHAHRVIQVREEARASLLAYGYLRGLSLSQVEKNSYPSFTRNRVYNRAHAIVHKYGSKEAAYGFLSWLKNTTVEIVGVEQ